MSGISFREALFLAHLPYRQSFYTRGGWSSTGGPGCAEWNSFLKDFFFNRELERAIEKAKEEEKSYPSDLTIKLAGCLLPITVVSFWDADYPRALAHIYDPPPVLFSWGEPSFNYRQYLGIVGTRRASPLCEAAIDLFLREKKKEVIDRGQVPEKELVLVSGLANGVDSFAHRAAIKNALAGIAVLGSGLLYAGPRSNLNIIQEARCKGIPFTLLSEFSPRTPAYPYHFPRRNRIIAGLCGLITIMQAPKKSGALITARYALEEGRELMVFDHPFFDTLPGSNEGGRALLKSGAEKIILPELENKLLRAPAETYHANPEQLSFWREQLQGSKSLGNNYYLKN